MSGIHYLFFLQFLLISYNLICNYKRVKDQINSGTYEGCTDVNILANLIKVGF